MRNPTFLTVIFLIFSSCSSTSFVDSWRNTEIQKFQPKKILVLGMTDNLTARKLYEEEITKELRLRKINAIASSNFFDPTFTHAEKNEEEINEILEQLIKNDFDAILITAIKGIDEKRSYSNNYYGAYANRWPYFGGYYFYYQDLYYTPNFYEDYKVYHIESSIYNINKDEDKSLVWVGSIDIVDPKKISTTVKSYSKTLIRELEKENLISKS